LLQNDRWYRPNRATISLPPWLSRSFGWDRAMNLSRKSHLLMLAKAEAWARKAHDVRVFVRALGARGMEERGIGGPSLEGDEGQIRGR